MRFILITCILCLIIIAVLHPKITTSVDLRPGKREINISKKFWTLFLPCFNKFRELFYE